MRITFDPAKDAGNVAKHGISLAPLGNRLHFVAYVERDGAIRIISLRKANSREVKRYAKDYQD